MKTESRFNGFINLLKPVGCTASDMVVKVKRITNSKVGHLGTLDPGAGGVLPLILGNATRLFDFLTFKQKKYRAEFTFGLQTDTLDSYGVVTETKSVLPDKDAVLKALIQFVGEIDQLPPNYSALSIGGVRAYKLARQGEIVELPTRKVTIYSFDLIEQRSPDTFAFDIVCSGGTYIRSLARDLANALNTVGYMSSLIRLSSGCFELTESHTLDEVSSNPEQCVIGIEEVLSKYMPITVIDEMYFPKLSNGVKIAYDNEAQSMIYCKGELFGVGLSVDGKLEMEYYLH